MKREKRISLWLEEIIEYAIYLWQIEHRNKRVLLWVFGEREKFTIVKSI